MAKKHLAKELITSNYRCLLTVSVAAIAHSMLIDNSFEKSATLEGLWDLHLQLQKVRLLQPLQVQ